MDFNFLPGAIRSYWYLHSALQWEFTPQKSDALLYEIFNILLSHRFKKGGYWGGERESYLQRFESSRTAVWGRGDCEPRTGSFFPSLCIPRRHPARSHPSSAPSRHRGLLFLLFLQASPMAKQEKGAQVWEVLRSLGCGNTWGRTGPAAGKSEHEYVHAHSNNICVAC